MSTKRVESLTREKLKKLGFKPDPGMSATKPNPWFSKPFPKYDLHVVLHTTAIEIYGMPKPHKDGRGRAPIWSCNIDGNAPMAMFKAMIKKARA